MQGKVPKYKVSLSKCVENDCFLYFTNGNTASII